VTACMHADQLASGHDYISKAETDDIVGRCITQINNGDFADADVALSALLRKHPNCYQALVARGTSRALAGCTRPAELRKAEADFSKAIEMLPDLADVWKRRSQARAALGNVAGAIKDLQDCLRLCVSSAALCLRLRNGRHRRWLPVPVGGRSTCVAVG
jgi:tetratricopeptide (TPR) repeat protein